MTLVAPLLERFFTERLIGQKNASAHTVSAYSDSFRLLLAFAQERTRKAPSKLELADLAAPLIGRFLAHLEKDRRNSVATRNARLAAVHSFFRFVALRSPPHAALVQRVLAIPHKRAERKLVPYLTRPEFEALLAAPDQTTLLGRRDHAILFVAIQTGLRVSELVGLTLDDVHLAPGGAYLRCRGKGRKERITPLTRQTVKLVRAYLRTRTEAPGSSPLFVSRRGGALSRDAVARLVGVHAARAAVRCTSLATKRVTPHVLRHTSAMVLLESGIDRSVIALWLGHESIETTEVYLQADLRTKERAIARTQSMRTRHARFRPPDPLLAFLRAL